MRSAAFACRHASWDVPSVVSEVQDAGLVRAQAGPVADVLAAVAGLRPL